jgi:hypothetical protein
MRASEWRDQRDRGEPDARKWLPVLRPPVVDGLIDIRPLGRGGFGVVYRAWQVGLDREVALKVDSRVLTDERDRRRFLREAGAAGRLSAHGHIVPVYDAGVAGDGRPYLVMELCPGGSLADRVRRDGPIPADEVRRIGLGIADALAAAHAVGILHRDVKPGNILTDQYGVAKLADFGLAAALDASGNSTATLETLTPAFAPPEAFAFARPSAPGDVYGLAATLYTLLAGYPPRLLSWPPESPAELAAGLRSAVAPIPGVHQDLLGVLDAALHPDPARRTQTAAALRGALAAVPAAGVRSEARGQRHGAAVASGAPAGSAVAAPTGPTAPVDVTARAAQPPRARSGRWRSGGSRGRVVAMVVAPVLVIAAAVGGTLLHRASGTAGSPAGGAATATQTPSPTVSPTATLPAALVVCRQSAGGALCPTTPLCWGDLVDNGDRRAEIATTSCGAAHRWEAYAAGRLPADAVDVTIAERNTRPEITRVCTVARERGRTRPGVDTTTWTHDVLPMTIPGYGAFFFCIAADRTGPSPAAPVFITGP